MRYLSADDIADIKNARGCGVSRERIAGHMRITVDELRAVLGEPIKRETPRSDKEAGCDLWSMDRLDGVL